MLVPSPTEDVKALIGDKNADEVSDLSEAEGDADADASSESSDDERNDATDVPNVLIQNKSIIGGKNNLTDFVDAKTSAEQEFESLTSQTSFSEARNSLPYFEEDYKRIERAVIELERQGSASTDEPVIVQHNVCEADVVHNARTSSRNSFIEEYKNLDDDSKSVRPVPAPR